MESLLPAISELIDLLRSWAKLPSAPREYLFESMARPSFDRLLAIHENYCVLLRQAIDTLPLYTHSSGLLDHNCSPADQKDEQFVKQIEIAKQVITKGRSEYEAKREAIRQEADCFFGAKLHKEEKRFLWAIIYYFIRPEIRIKDNDMIDMEVKWLEEQGPHETIDTPSSAIAGRIANKTDPFEIKKDLEEALFNQLARWKEVCRLYSELKLAVHKN